MNPVETSRKDDHLRSEQAKAEPQQAAEPLLMPGGISKRHRPGKPLKQIRVKLFTPGNKSFKTVFLKAPNGRIFTPDGELMVLQRVAAQLEQAFPFEMFDMIQVGRGEYNFVHIGPRPVDEAALLVGGMPLGETASVEVGS